MGRRGRSGGDPPGVEGAVHWRELLPFRDGAPAYWGFVSLLGFTAIVISFFLPIAELLGILAVVACGVGLMAGKLRFRSGAAGACLIALLVLAALSLDGALDPTWARFRLEELMKITVIFMVAVLVLPWGRRPMRFAAVWFVVFLLFPVRGAFVNYFIAGYRLNGRMIWNHVWENPNDLAGVALVTAAVGLALHAVVRGKRTRALLGVGIALCLVVIVLSGSRAVLVGTMAATLALVTYRRFEARIVMAVGALAIVGVVLAPSGIRDRVATLAHLDEPAAARSVDAGSMMERRELWQGAVAIIREHPLLGVGIGSSGAAYRYWAGSHDPTGRDVFNFTYYSGPTISLHNTFLTVWAELGTVGLLLFLGFLGSVWGKLRTVRHRWAQRGPPPRAVLGLDALQAGFVGLMVAAFFASYDVLTHFYLYCALVVGWCGAVERGLAGKPGVRKAKPVRGVRVPASSP